MPSTAIAVRKLTKTSQRKNVSEKMSNAKVHEPARAAGPPPLALSPPALLALLLLPSLLLPSLLPSSPVLSLISMAEGIAEQMKAIMQCSGRGGAGEAGAREGRTGQRGPVEAQPERDEQGGCEEEEDLHHVPA